MFLRLLPAAALVAATVLSAAAPASAQGYRYSDDCTRRIHDNGTTGAILGGIAGAVVGSNVARGGGRTGGAILGGAAGAAIGNNIARSSTKDRCRGHYRTAPVPVAAYGYAEPAPVYVAPAPVYVAPAPVYVESYPVYVREPHGHAYGHWKHHHHDD